MGGGFWVFLPFELPLLLQLADTLFNTKHPAAAVEEVVLAGMQVVGDKRQHVISKKNELVYLILKTLEVL